MHQIAGKVLREKGWEFWLLTFVFSHPICHSRIALFLYLFALVLHKNSCSDKDFIALSYAYFEICVDAWWIKERRCLSPRSALCKSYLTTQAKWYGIRSAGDALSTTCSDRKLREGTSFSYEWELKQGFILLNTFAPRTLKFKRFKANLVMWVFKGVLMILVTDEQGFYIIDRRNPLENPCNHSCSL